MKIKIQIIFCVFFLKIYCYKDREEILRKEFKQFLENCKSMLREYETCIEKQEDLNENYFKDLIIENVTKYIALIMPTINEIKALYKKNKKNNIYESEEIFIIDDIIINESYFNFLTSKIVILSLEKIIDKKIDIKQRFLLCLFKILLKIITENIKILELNLQTIELMLSVELYLYNIKEIMMKRYFDIGILSIVFAIDIYKHIPYMQKKVINELIDIFKMMVNSYNNYIYTVITIPTSEVALIIETEFKPILYFEILKFIDRTKALCIELNLHLPIAKILSTSLKVITEDNFFIKHKTNNIINIFMKGSEQMLILFYELIELIKKKEDFFEKDIKTITNFLLYNWKPFRIMKYKLNSKFETRSLLLNV